MVSGRNGAPPNLHQSKAPSGKLKGGFLSGLLRGNVAGRELHGLRRLCASLLQQPPALAAGTQHAQKKERGPTRFSSSSFFFFSNIYIYKYFVSGGGKQYRT